MGVITKMLYRGNILAKPRHRNFFLDMEENIHIHYRDLRIELSRDEFEEISSVFSKQSCELQTIIDEKDYQDGVFANANQDDVRILTESRLQEPVKYHPRRISIEECVDGYHLHYRNYKILIDHDEFRELVMIFSKLDLNKPYPSSYEDVQSLLEVNDIDFIPGKDDKPGKHLSIKVAKHHLPRTREILRNISFKRPDAKVEHWAGEKITISIEVDKKPDIQLYRNFRDRKNVQPLSQYLIANRDRFDANEMNTIQCQVMDLYYALDKGKALNVELDPFQWFYNSSSNKVIFPYSSQTNKGKSKDKLLYQSWRNLIKPLELHFLKPKKIKFAGAQQVTLKELACKTVLEKAASFQAVSKIYVMGSLDRQQLGEYEIPFIHGKLAKLASDIDILIEIDPAHEANIPLQWDKHLNKASSNGCAVYHIGELPLEGSTKDWSETYPNIPFIGHLLDAYVYLPSRGEKERKGAFLKKFDANCIYDRETDGAVYPSEKEKEIAQQLSSIFSIEKPIIEPFKATTVNTIYRTFIDDKAYMLKLFEAAGNYKHNRIEEHVYYERDLVNHLSNKGIKTAAIKGSDTKDNWKINDIPGLLFEFIPGRVNQKPEYPIESVTEALAKIHQVQEEHPHKSKYKFPFDDACMIWLPEFDKQLKAKQENPDFNRVLNQLSEIIKPLHKGPNRKPMYESSPVIHCHGDVTPKNFIEVDGEIWFFDFNNAFYGPRIADVIDGAYEFSLAEKYIRMADFARFQQFIDHYDKFCPLSESEKTHMDDWINLMGLIKVAKEIRVANDKNYTKQTSLRTKRALAIADFLIERNAL